MRDELRVYLGTDPETGQRRQETRTVRGSRTQAQRELRSLAALASVGSTVGARTTLDELLERWFAASEPNWAATTVRSTRSIIDCQLKPKLGHVLLRELQTVTIDDFYASLRVNGSFQGGSLSRGSVLRVHGVLHRALAQAVRWERIWSNPATTASPPAWSRRRCGLPLHRRCCGCSTMSRPTSLWFICSWRWLQRQALVAANF
jgi:hypothetical protein